MNLTYERPRLTAYQVAALFGPERYAIVEASTKVGKTTAAYVWLIEQALRAKSGDNFWWVAPIREQAKMVFRRLKTALPRHLYDSNQTQLSLTMRNGAVLWFKGADHPDSLYGEDVHAAVIDEATRVKEPAWHAVRSTVSATEGPIRIIGNVKGRRNWAYRLARKAQSGAPNMSYTKITCADAVRAGLLSTEDVEDARQQLPEAVFRELYMAEPSDDGGNPFGLEAIHRCVGALRADTPFVWGWDLGKAQDWTVGIGLDVQGRLSRLERFQSPWERTIPRILQATGSTPALVDSSGVGDPVLEALQLRGRDQDGQFEGFKFTQQSKQQLMEGLALSIQQQDIRFPAGVIVDELEAFEYVYTRTGVRYSAPAGLHDDAVCALALAVAYLATVVRRPSMAEGAPVPLYY